MFCFSILHTGQTVRPIFTLHGSNDVYPARTVLFGVRTINDVNLWNYAPKTSKKGVNRQFPAKSQNTKLQYYQNHSTDLNQILQIDKDQQCHLAVNPAHAYKVCNMADGRHIGNRKLAITPQPFNRLRQNITRTRRS